MCLTPFKESCMEITSCFKPYHTVKKEKKIFLTYKEIQKGSGAKSYMRKGFLIYEEMHKYLVIYEKPLHR
jgi:hypothetical protein